jgi:hypothetical protein
MKVAIHQPEHMQWAGFFHKTAKADIYVILDCINFSKNNWQIVIYLLLPKTIYFG